MRDGVDKSVVLFVAADFANEECCIKDQAKDDCEKKTMPSTKEYLSPVEQSQPTFRAIASATRHAPNVMKNAIGYVDDL
jgi:hypothetical protein